MEYFLLENLDSIQNRKILVSFIRRKCCEFSFYSEENIYFKSNEMFHLATN